MSGMFIVIVFMFVFIGWTVLVWNIGYADGKMDEREKWEFKRLDAAIEKVGAITRTSVENEGRKG